jgi:hypothetical protein
MTHYARRYTFYASRLFVLCSVFFVLPAQTNALKPVMARPTISVLISRVPS